MTKSLQAAIEWVQDQMLTLEGVRPKAAPDYLEESAGGKFPFFAAWPGPGEWSTGSAGDYKGMLSIRLEMHVERKNLPGAVKLAMKYVDAVPLKILASAKMGGTVDARGVITFDGLVGMQYGSVDTIGFRWLINDIKIQS